MTASYGRDIDEWCELLGVDDRLGVEALAEARSRSHDDPAALLEQLVASTDVRPEDLARWHAIDNGVPFLDLREFRINRRNRELLDADFCLQHRVFPVFMLDDVMSLATLQPEQFEVIDQVRLTVRCDVMPVVVEANELEQLLGWAYGDDPDEIQSADDADAQVSEEESSAVRIVANLLNHGVNLGASDVHIEPTERSVNVRLRVDGLLRALPPPPKRDLPSVIARLKVMAGLDISETRRPLDGHFAHMLPDGERIDLRIATTPTIHGEAAVLRLLREDRSRETIADLGMAPHDEEMFRGWVRNPHGLILVTGPTGSGKTTTLYAAVRFLNDGKQNIITLEDPVEVPIDGIRQMQVNEQIGLTFAQGLRSILRQDPDCILPGEIRDTETAQIAVRAAITGHLVISTLHTDDAPSAMMRLVDMGVPRYLVGHALVGVLAQRLVRRLCPDCERGKLETRCRTCGGTGYRGRIGVFQLLPITPAVRQMLLAGANTQQLQQEAERRAMTPLTEAARRLVDEGLTSIEEADRLAQDVGVESRPEDLASRVRTDIAEPSDTGDEDLVRQWLTE